jgi:hypothetical protein
MRKIDPGSTEKGAESQRPSTTAAEYAQKMVAWKEAEPEGLYEDNLEVIETFEGYTWQMHLKIDEHGDLIMDKADSQGMVRGSFKWPPLARLELIATLLRWFPEDAQNLGGFANPELAQAIETVFPTAEDIGLDFAELVATLRQLREKKNQYSDSRRIRK